MIRILQCVAGLERGGYETLLMNLYRKLDRSKVQFDFLYSFDGVYVPEVQALGGRLYQLPFITQCGPFAYRRHLMRFFKEHPEYTVVHSHMDKFSGLVMECAQKAGVPVRIAHSHGVKNEGGLVFDLVKNYYGRMLAPACTHRFACSVASADFLYGGPDGVRFIKNGIDADRFTVQDRRTPGSFTVVQIGRFAPVKNHAKTLEIFAALLRKEPAARLVLAGTGPLMEPMRKKAEELGIGDHTDFLGDCNDIPGLLASADAMVMPSLHEAFSMTMIEAQCAGVPCVVSDTIAAECRLVDDFIYMPLEASADTWAEALLQYKGKPRIPGAGAVRGAGYDIADTAAAMQEFYLSL